MTALAILTIGGVGLVGRLVTLPFRLDRAMTSAFLIVVMFSNSGNYGLPVVLFAFGRDALGHATVYFVANAVATYTLGVFLASAGRRSIGQAAWGVLRVPAVWGVVAAGIILGLGVPLPPAVMRPIELLSGAALPTMILVLGMQLERGAWPERPLLVALAAVLALVVTPLIAFGASQLLGLTGVARQAAIVQAGMPSAVLTTILALEFDVAPSFVTACVMLSTLASPITVTLLIAALQ
jgi:predicted permease